MKVTLTNLGTDEHFYSTVNIKLRLYILNTNNNTINTDDDDEDGDDDDDDDNNNNNNKFL